MTTHPADLLRAATTADPARPLITFYDDATGERVELSTATVSNWVAKAANLLQEELDITLGTSLRVELPAHWQAHVILLAAWSLGACVVLDPAAEVDLRVVGPDNVIRPDNLIGPDGGAGGARLAVAMSPMGLGFSASPGAATLPRGAVDFGAEVLGHDDVFVAWAPAPAEAVLLRGTESLDSAGLDAQARSAWTLKAGERLLTDVEASDPRGVLLLPALLAVDGSVVLCRHLGRDLLPARVQAERVTRVEVTGATDQAPR